MSSRDPQTKCPLWKSAAGSIRSGPYFSLRWCAFVTLRMTCHVWQIAKSRMILFPTLLNRILFVRLNLSTFLGLVWGLSCPVSPILQPVCHEIHRNKHNLHDLKEKTALVRIFPLLYICQVQSYLSAQISDSLCLNGNWFWNERGLTENNRWLNHFRGRGVRGIIDWPSLLIRF